MQKINFKNLPDTSTPLNASTLNQMQDNIENALFSGDYDDLENKPTIPTIENNLDSDSTTNGASVHAVNAVIDNITTCSTSEKTIGKDTNGKPIYRKTIIYSTALTGGNNDIPHNIANLGKVYNAYGNLNGSGTGGNYMIGAFESATKFVSINSVNYSYVKLRVGSDWGSSFTSGCTVTLEYTKTTD